MRTLLEDVENVRRAKMYEGMGAAAQEVQQAVKVGVEQNLPLLLLPLCCVNIERAHRAARLHPLTTALKKKYC